MTAVIREISDFDHFLNIFKSRIKVSFESQDGIVESYLVVLNNFCKFENESKFCQNVKFFMTAIISEISDFDHFLNILNRLFFVIEKFSSLRLLTKIFHPKIFLTLNFSSRKNKKRNIDENFSQRKF